MKDHADNLKETFWKRLDDVTAGMLEVEPGRSIPMSPYGDSGENAVWFITSDGSEAYEAAQSGKAASFTVAEQNAKLYARVEGSLAVVNDKAKLDELWSPVAASWFKDGREDEHVRLICFRPGNAEIWATDGGAGFLYEISKANLTEKTPDLGEHASVSF